MDAFKGKYERTSADKYEEMLKVKSYSKKNSILFVDQLSSVNMGYFSQSKVYLISGA